MNVYFRTAALIAGIFCASVLTQRAGAQSPSPGWQDSLIKLLTEQTDQCQQSVINCNVFVGRGLVLVWGVRDLDVGGPSQFLTANQIAVTLTTTPHWRMVGMATDPGVAQQAQDFANSNGAVLAVWRNPLPADKDPKRHGHGHVALVIPAASPIPSVSWGMPVPNVASFVMNNLAASFIGGPLSKAFGLDIKDEVQVWVRDQN